MIKKDPEFCSVIKACAFDELAIYLKDRGYEDRELLVVTVAGNISVKLQKPKPRVIPIHNVYMDEEIPTGLQTKLAKLLEEEKLI